MGKPTVFRLVACSFLSIGLATLLAVGVLLRTPVLLPWRDWLTPFFFAALVACAICLALHGWVSERRSAWWYGATFLWLSALAIGGSAELKFQWYRHTVLESVNAQSQELGAHMVVGYRDIAVARHLAKTGLIGGIFLGPHNIKGRLAGEIASEIESLQALRRFAGLPPLWICVDHEGGSVSRLSPPLPATPSLQKIVSEVSQEATYRAAVEYGFLHGQGLATVGVNINLAPVADLRSPEGGAISASRSLLHLRSISSDPNRVAQAVVGYVKGLESAGVLGAIKHFPGLGRVAVDTHLFPATVDTPIHALEKSDWLPFKEGLQGSRSLLMVGHVKLGAVDPHRLATRSPAVIDIVRTQWSHDGVLITDDLTMGAVLMEGSAYSGVQAINAGIDLLLVSYDIDRYFEIFYHLLQAEQGGDLDTSMLQRSARRLDHLQAPRP